MGKFLGKLNTNEICSALYNMIISQMVFADPLEGGVFGKLLEENRVDGSMYGDIKTYTDNDVLGSHEFGYDTEAVNLLKTNRPTLPETQAITITEFRQIDVTIDQYFTKRAWMNEGTFTDFNGAILAWLSNTKKIYEATFYNTHFGCEIAVKGKQNLTVQIPVASASETDSRMRAQLIAKSIADILTDVEDPSRDYNDNEFLKTFSPETLMVVWNAKYVNEITKLDVPTIFHDAGLIDKPFDYRLPARYFGKVNAAGGTGDGKTYRSLLEVDYNPPETARNSEDYDRKLHIFPGDFIPTGKAFKENETYTEDAAVICKIIRKGSYPIMSAFSTQTSFVNPRSLTENHYLTWGYNKLEHLNAYPMITLKETNPKGK